MKIDFEKINNRWYVVFEDYEGDFEDLEMVDGADALLDVLSPDGMTAQMDCSLEEPSSDDFYILELLLHDEIGATYEVQNCADFKGTIWLCNVAHFFFGGEHPEVIYFTSPDM